METEDLWTTSTLSEKAAQLPVNPGVYLMKDHQGSVIYVGKAKSLRNRVRSYFQRFQDVSQKTRLMVSKIADIETIVTQTEKDALILENSLIKKYRPRFNVLFRDDKEYPYLKLSTNEPYPNLTIVRKPKKDGSLYFGPFASSQAVRETLKVLHKIFPIRKCSGKHLKKTRPCMYYQLGQCFAPCCQNVNHYEYRRIVKDVQLFLQGRGSEIIQQLKKKMEHEAQNLNFELAAQIRDQFTAIEKTLEKQSIVYLDFVDRDVFSFYREGLRMGITALFVRSGRMIGSRNFFLKKLQLTDEEILSSFISQYYHQGELIPHEVIVPRVLGDRGVLEEWLREKKGGSIKVINPKRGKKKELLKMATQNAEIMFSKNQTADRDSESILKQLQERLHLKNYPSRIQCFDISNIAGTSAVGSMAAFEDATPLKEGYRRFRIKTVQQPDDYAMMHEVLTRHLDRVKREGTLPDLIIIDGGKGQLGVLLKALRDNDITAVDAVALAKGKQGGKVKKKAEEKVFIPHRKNPVIFPKQSRALFLLQRIRDEAHRFAISYHKTLKKKKDFTSIMESVPGIGTKTVKAVLKHFGSIEKARQATREELANVPSVTKNRAGILYSFFHSSPDS
jgi:excinuclease ABC subunit C